MSIVLDQLTKRYQDHPVVNNVSLTIADGELVVLLGPSGSGKSPVLRMIAGLAGVDAGRVLLHDPADHPGLAIREPGSRLRVIEARSSNAAQNGIDR